jgi:hypothetical protein
MVDWLKKLIYRIASEVHRSKIDEFEKRIQDMERKHEVMLKSILDNEKKMEKLEDRQYDANLQASQAIGAINVLIQSGKEARQIIEGGGDK